MFVHARQLALQQRGVRLQQALDTAGAFRAGDGADARALAQQRVVGDAALHQQQVAAVLGQGQGVLGRLAQQQFGLARADRLVAAGQAQLQLQGNAAVGHLDLQGMAEGAHQFAAAQGVSQVVVAAVLAAEQHQAAAVAEGEQLALVQRGGSLQAIAVALQQFHQACARQVAQLLLGAELDRQHGAAGVLFGLLRRIGRRRGCRLEVGLGGCGLLHVAQVGEGIVFVMLDDGRRARGGLGEFFVVVDVGVQVRHVEVRFALGLFVDEVLFVIQLGVVVRLGFRLFRYQARLQLTGEIADLVLATGAGGGIIRITQPYTQLQQRRGDVAAQAQAERQGQGQQDQAEQAHALQADGHRLLELPHVQADAQLPGDHFLKGDGRGVEAFGLAKNALGRARAGLGEDAVVHAVDGGMGHQRVFRQVAEQHVEAEDVVGHQQFGGRGGGLHGQALAQGIGLLLHGLLELHAHHPGVDHQRQGDQQQAVAGDAQGERHAALAQGIEQQQEEIVGFDLNGPVHRARLFSNEIAAQYNHHPQAGKAPPVPCARQTGLECAPFR